MYNYSHLKPIKDFLTITFVFVFLSIQAQKIKVETQAQLPSIIKETSGLVAGANATVWTHNDSGGEAKLYKINSKAELLRTIRISHVENVDWEDMANDYLGHVYIADIGNNENRRTDLKILKIPHPDSLQTDSIIPEIIYFKYENQKYFPPPPSQLNFDAEAIIAYSDSLYIFTKNRTKPYSKYTYIYALKNESGQQIAILKDSLYLPHTHKLSSWVTGATRCPQSDLVILISHKKAWLIKNFRTSNHLQIIPSKISGIYSQKEAIAIDLNNTIWISNEKYKILKAKLKKGQLLSKDCH